MLEPRTDSSGPQVHNEWMYEEEQTDPVYEGMVKDFSNFHDSLQTIYDSLESFMEGVDHLAGGLRALSEGVVDTFAHLRDRQLALDSRKLREAANQILHEDAPNSALAKLRRNLEFNMMAPIREHVENNDKLKKEMEKRQRRLDELREAKKQIDICIRSQLSETDERYVMAQAEFELSMRCFLEADRYVFEWLYLLEEYRDDILDSSLQTLKFLQYEFFAQSAHAFSRTLPARMEFRPMREMDPEQLQAQVEAHREEARLEQDSKCSTHVTGFAERVVERLVRDDAAEVPPCPVDFLSLAALQSQGFEEAPVRRALRLHHNDTQAALEWLLHGGREDDEVRKPVARGDRLGLVRPRAEALGSGPCPTELGAA